VSRALRLAVLACALVFAACAGEATRPAAAQSKPAADPNGALIERVRRALVSDREIAANDIDVSARGGVVSLWGKVGSAREIQRAVEVARGVPGVQRVESNLKTN
jgi:hyperosmotically inducible periplasmic protein